MSYLGGIKKWIFILNAILAYGTGGRAQDGGLLEWESESSDLKIEGIECVNNKITRCDLIKTHLYLHPGDSISEEEIENAKLRLKASGLFLDANVYLQKGSKRGQVNVVLDVQEQNPTYFNLNILSSKMDPGSHSDSTQEVHVGNRNLFGLGKGLSFSFKNSDQVPTSQSFSLRYEDPNFFGSEKYFGSLSFEQNQISRRDEGYAEGVDYSLENSTLERIYRVELGRRIFDFSYLKASMAFEQLSGNRYSVKKSIIGDSTQIDLYSNPFRYYNKSLTFEYGWNTQDDSFSPRSGSQFAIGLSYLSPYQNDSSFNTTALSYNLSEPRFYYLNFSKVFELNANWVVNSETKLAQRSVELLPSGEEGYYYQSLGIAYYGQRKGEAGQSPDRYKIFSKVGLSGFNDKKYNSYFSQVGVSYLTDGFGEVSLGLLYGWQR